ncbi:MAG: phosphatase PAP2 family protein [Romboutsia sp.]
MDTQLTILQFFQSIRSPLLNGVFLIFTVSTELPVIVLFTAIMYWCINKKYGQKILFSLVGNIMLNTGIKEFVKVKRPIGTPGLESLRVETATGYSFPSGHTQTGTAFWTSIMSLFKINWLYILGTIMILGIGISRLYLGVHWPIDVLFGWIFGVLFTTILLKIFDIVDRNKNYSILLFLLVPFALFTMILNSVEYVKMFGLFTGFILGYIVEDKYIDFATGNEDRRRINFGRKINNRFENKSRLVVNIYRVIVGILTLGLVYVGLKYIAEFLIISEITANIEMLAIVLDYIRYTLVVFYAVAGAPALFKKFKLG